MVLQNLSRFLVWLGHFWQDYWYFLQRLIRVKHALAMFGMEFGMVRQYVLKYIWRRLARFFGTVWQWLERYLASFWYSFYKLCEVILAWFGKDFGMVWQGFWHGLAMFGSDFMLRKGEGRGGLTSVFAYMWHVTIYTCSRVTQHTLICATFSTYNSS